MTTASSIPASAGPAAAAVPARAEGAAIVYRLYDVGYEIALDRALDLLAASAPERVRPVRGEAQAIQIKNPPVTVLLGRESVRVGDARCEAEVSARVFDFGVISLRLRLPTPGEVSWGAFVRFGGQVQATPELGAVLEHHLRLLLERIRPAIARPMLAPVTEDYVVFRVDRLLATDGRPVPGETLRDEDVAPLLVGEGTPLSASARRELLPHRFSYTTDDVAVLAWNSALVVEPVVEDTDVQYVLEFANAQLLELRAYDALLDDELPRMYDRVEGARGGWAVLRRGYSRVLGELQTLVADSTEFVERVENSLKVTDDVYLARIYSAALEIFRGRTWRAGIDRKLGIIRDTYAMLNGEAQAARMEALEAAIVVLIVAEIVMAAFRR
jgi:hypothetical protein